MPAGSVILAAQIQWEIWQHWGLWVRKPTGACPPPSQNHSEPRFGPSAAAEGFVRAPWWLEFSASRYVCSARHYTEPPVPQLSLFFCRLLSLWCTIWWQPRWSLCLRIRQMSSWSSSRTSVISSATLPCTAKSSFPAPLPATILQGRSSAGKLFHWSFFTGFIFLSLLGLGQ